MRNIYTKLLLLIAGATQKELARQVQYLKIENQILRSKLPTRVPVTLQDRNRLVRFGARLTRAMLHQLVSIVHPDTLLRWIREDRKGRRAKPAKVGRRRTHESIRKLTVKMARETGWGYTEPHPYYAPLQLALQLRGVTPEWSVPWDMVHQTSRGVFGAAA